MTLVANAVVSEKGGEPELIPGTSWNAAVFLDIKVRTAEWRLPNMQMFLTAETAV